MKLDYGSSSLVILGGWNPNVFTPFWIEKKFQETKFLDAVDSNNLEQGKLNFDIHIDEVYSIKHAPITVNFKGLKVNFIDGRLDFILVEGDDFTLLEEFALKLCSYLPNTPVTGYGVNFAFVEEKNTKDIIDIIQSNGMSRREYLDIPLTFERYSFGAEIDNINTNIHIEIDNKNNKCFFKLNYHFNINDLSQFDSGISENPMRALQEKAVKFISETYKLRVEV